MSIFYPNYQNYRENSISVNFTNQIYGGFSKKQFRPEGVIRREYMHFSNFADIMVYHKNYRLWIAHDEYTKN